MTLTGTSRLDDLVSERVREGTADEPLVVPERAVVIPGSRILPGTFAHEHGLRATTAVDVKTRDAGSDARVALEAALR
jgi:2,3,4,5-tetrahydropyridine-2-carboxylate N-succinyltransferase